MADTTNYRWTKPTVGGSSNGWGDTLNLDLDLIDSTMKAVSDRMPTGAIVMWGGSTAAPTGYLLCDGAAVSRTTYADLFAAIGTTHGAGDGSTTFNVPNLEDRFVAGAGGSYGVAGQGGSATQTTTVTVQPHTLTASEIPAHSHPISDPTHGHTLHDPGHSHTVNDSGHSHSLSQLNGFISTPGAGSALAGGGTVSAKASPTSDGAFTGVSLSSSGAGMSLDAAATGITVLNNTGGGGGHDHPVTVSNTTNLPPYYALCFMVKT